MLPTPPPRHTHPPLTPARRARATPGNDFRPDYKRLAILKQQFPDTPLLALTATATQRVRARGAARAGRPPALSTRAPRAAARGNQPHSAGTLAAHAG